jgi:hypothetical protein
LATSSGSVSRPSGTLAVKFARFSGVSGTPTKDSKSPVPESSGAMALTRMLNGPNSAARPLVALSAASETDPGVGRNGGLTFVTAPLELLYHTRPVLVRKCNRL